MTDSAKSDTVELLTELDQLRVIIDAQDKGRDLLVLAFGQQFYLEESLGEIMASTDRKRIGTPSMYVSRIVEALRFSRSQPELFRGFVDANRQEHNLAELAGKSVR